VLLPPSSYLNLLSSTDGGASFELQKIAPSVILGGTNLVWGGACRWECQIYRGVCRGVHPCWPWVTGVKAGGGGVNKILPFKCLRYSNYQS
jgi:hypothetical protein